MGKVVAKALISGAELDTAAIFGADPGAAISLPSYPWQQQQFRFVPTPEAVGPLRTNVIPSAAPAIRATRWNGMRTSTPLLFPALPITRSANTLYSPALDLLRSGSQWRAAWLRTNDARIADCEILTPLDLTNGETREIMSRVSPNSSTLEIFSRPRLSEAVGSYIAAARCCTAIPVPWRSPAGTSAFGVDLRPRASIASPMPADCTTVRRSACSKAPSVLDDTFISSRACERRKQDRFRARSDSPRCMLSRAADCI